MAVLEGSTKTKSRLFPNSTFILLAFLPVKKLLLLPPADEPPATAVYHWPNGLCGPDEGMVRSAADENQGVLEQNI